MFTLKVALKKGKISQIKYLFVLSRLLNTYWCLKTQTQELSCKDSVHEDNM